MATEDSPAPSTTTSTPSSQSAGSAQESCEVCDALEELLDATDFVLDLDESQVYNDFCAEHSPIFERIKTRYYQHFDSLRKARILNPGADYELAIISLFRYDGDIPVIEPSNYRLRRYQTYEVLLHSKDSPGQEHSNAPVCVIDPEWINLKIAKSWVEKCIAEHTSECQSSGEKHVSPAWLIDTEENRLVQGNNSLSFVALSYRWGSATSQKMDKKAFQDLMRPGSFAQDNGLLTPTVRDAIYTVRTMGERYLWVDAICLEPDDEEQLVKQLQLMGSIYASAKLTIVALDGNASTGLKRTNPKSSPSSLPDIFPWRNGKSLMVRHLPALSVHDTEASEYFARGWTYQEYTLSRRRLIFGKQQIHWQCSCASWHEDLPQLDDTAERLPSQAFPNIKNGWPDFEELLASLNEYNSRELECPEDAFPAVNGLLSYLENYSFDQGFLFGLPRASFDAALMWSCYFGMANLSNPVRPGLSRRQRSDRRHSLLPDTYLPSWSWIGWRGADIRMLDREARFLSWDSSSNSCIEDLTELLELSVLTIPITQWYSLSSADGTGKQPISTYPTVYKENPEILYDEDVWTVKENVDGCLIPSEIGVTHLYEHVNFPGREFFWPLPKASPEGSDQPTKLDQSPFISCHTKRAWFAAAQQRNYILEVNMDVHLGLFDAKRRLCGWLQLPNFESLMNSPKFLTPIYGEEMDRDWAVPPLAEEGTYLNPFPPRDMQLELVAICIRKYPEINEDGDMQLQEFYGVLWVEWTDGVAYRKGCGYVLKELWEEQDLEDVDLILG